MQLHASKPAIFAITPIVMFAIALPAATQTASAIRVRLHLCVAIAGKLPSDVLAKLEALVGTGLSLLAMTRTGAFNLT